jgi:hypothetical protein
MTAKLTASADGSKVLIGTAAEDALEIDSVTKTIKALSPYAYLPLASYANDSAAAAGGVAIGGLYHTTGTVKVRLV